MHVAFVSDWFAPRLGGIESHLIGLGQALVAKGHQVTAITAQPRAQDAHPPLRVVPLAVRHLPVLDLALPFGLIDHLTDALIRAAPDIVHVHASIVAPACLAAIRAADRLGLPLVLTFHSDLRAFGAVLPLLADMAGPVALTAVSASVAAQLGRRAWQGAGGAVLPNGFDRGFWSAAAPIDRPKSDAFRIVSAIRLHRKKRPMLLADMAHEVAQATGRQVRLVIAGEGAPRFSRALAGRADLPGWLAPEALRSLYHGADVFVQPSRHESFGLSAIEARAAGLPVVGRADTGLAEFIASGRDGLLCDSDADMVQALIGLARDPQAGAALRGPRTDLAQFDWPQVAARHLGLYTEVAVARNAGAISRTSRGR